MSPHNPAIRKSSKCSPVFPFAYIGVVSSRIRYRVYFPSQLLDLLSARRAGSFLRKEVVVRKEEKITFEKGRSEKPGSLNRCKKGGGNL